MTSATSPDWSFAKTITCAAANFPSRTTFAGSMVSETIFCFGIVSSAGRIIGASAAESAAGSARDAKRKMDVIFIAIEAANEKPVRVGTLSPEITCLRDGVRRET